KRGNYARSIELLEPARERIVEPEALFYLCLAYLETGATKSALEIAPAIERRAANDPGALLSAGRLLAAKELYAPALALLEKAALALPQSAEAQYSAAFTLFKLRRYGAMAPYLERAGAIEPRAPRVPLLAAMAGLDTGRTAEAAEQVRRALAVEPGKPFAQYLWGRVLVEQQSHRQAV